MIPCECLPSGVEWETLVSGGMAALAGLGSVYMIARQIKLQREHHDAQRLRELVSASVLLPAAISELRAVIKSPAIISTRFLIDSERTPEKRRAAVTEMQVQHKELSSATISCIRDFTSCLKLAEDVQHVKSIINYYHYMTSKFNSIYDGFSVDDGFFKDLVFDSIKLQYLIGRLEVNLHKATIEGFGGESPSDVARAWNDIETKVQGLFVDFEPLASFKNDMLEKIAAFRELGSVPWALEVKK